MHFPSPDFPYSYSTNHADFVCLLLRFIPVFFEKDIDSGIPRLTAEGRKALEDELRTTEAGP